MNPIIGITSRQPVIPTSGGELQAHVVNSVYTEAVRRSVTYYTTLAAAVATCRAIRHLDDSDVNRLQDLHKEVAA